MAKKKEKEKYINNHIVDAITPVGIEFHQSDFWYGDLLARVMVITKYPTRAKVAWLSRIANMDGVTCSIDVEPTESGKLIEKISKSMSEANVKMNNGGSPIALKRAEQQYNDADKLLTKIDQEQENVFYVTISIMITGRDKEELDQRTKKVQSVVSGSKMKAKTATFEQEDGLLTVSPYGMLKDSIANIGRRNMPSSTIAGAFPFNTSGINDGKGCLLGKDSSGGIILLDSWKRGGDRTNSNWTILGPPGVGKSTAVKHIFGNEYSQGSKIIIIDPEREYKDMCKNLGGQWINCGGGKGGRINPLQVKDVPLDEDDDEEPILFKDEGKGMGALALHFQTLRTFFNLYLKDLKDIDKATLEELLEELYAKHNIFWNTDTSKVPSEQYPIMEDLFNLANSKKDDEQFSEKQRERYENIALLLRRSAVGADSALWNGHTTIKADSDFIVLDTHDLQEADDTIKRTQYFNILTWAWQQMSLDREEKVFLGVDESYLLVDPEVPQALQYLRNFSKRLRKYMGGLGVISHSAIDFLDPAVRRHGQALLDNPCFKFIMGADGKNLEELTELLKLTEAEQEMLSRKKRGHGLLIAGSKRLHAIVELADHELELFGKGGGN